MQICVSVYTNKTISDYSAVNSDFVNRKCKVLSIYEPRNADYSTNGRTYVTYQITLHRSNAWGLAKQWRTSPSPSLPDGWLYEHGPDVFIHSYELPIDEAFVHLLCDMCGPIKHIEYKHVPNVGHYHAKITMACAVMASALVQLQNGCIHHDKCIFVNFNRFPCV